MDESLVDVQRVQRNGLHLLSLINDILDLAKVEAGRQELRLEQVELSKLLEHARATVAPLMANNGNHCDVICNGCETILDIDGGKLLQIILNLLSNAAKFTENGRVALIAKLSPERLEITVTDSGIGLAKEQAEFIFSPFSQADGSVTRKYQGTGLGLAITKQFCQLMGGDVTVDSALGEGASFRVKIPLPVIAAVANFIAKS